jgi:hypothetical protein
MSELQVSLVSLAHSESVEEELTSASETAVVERICGTVLSEAYDCGGGVIREWIVISRPPMLHAEFDQASGVKKKPATDCICIMGWIELHSSEGTTDWRLFTRVMREIESMEKRALALCLRKKTFCVDSHGKLSNALEIPHRQLPPLLRFTFEDGGQKRQTEVKREHVLPSGSWKQYKLVRAQKNRVWETTAEMADCKGSGTRGMVPPVRDPGMIDITDRYALLIGNSDYQGTLRDGVSWCTKDAEDMAHQLACDTLGVYKFTTMVLVNKKKEEIEDSIREWVRGLPRRCVALVMFSGHALEAQGKNYLLPVDAPEDMSDAEIRYKCISLDMIMDCILEQLDRESLIIALLDCCREETETLTRGPRKLGGTGKRGLGPVNLSGPDSAAVFVGYAAAPGMCAMENHR